MKALGWFHELGGCSCLNDAILVDLRPQMVKPVIGRFQPGFHDGHFGGGHGLKISYSQLRRNRANASCKEAGSHGPVQERGDETSVQAPGIAFKPGVAREFRLNTAVFLGQAAEVQSEGIAITANKAARVRLLPRTQQRVSRRI